MRKEWLARLWRGALLSLMGILPLFNLSPDGVAGIGAGVSRFAPEAPGDVQVFLPAVFSAGSLSPARRVNAPGFDGQVLFDETAIFWFGEVGPSQNPVDVRVGYNQDELYVRIGVADRRLWYDETPSTSTLDEWDSAAVYVSTTGNQGFSLGSPQYAFIGQLYPCIVEPCPPRDPYQAAYQGDGSAWVNAALPFTTSTIWRSPNGLNDGYDDHGWIIEFKIPFSSLGGGGQPPGGTLWGLAVVLYDRDDAAGSYIAPQTWPENAVTSQPATWGQLHFGLPSYSPGNLTPTGSATIRQGLNGAVVPDGMVGGGMLCGDGNNFWSQWGNANYANTPEANIQNQSDVADWPCFSRYYVTFPLDALPPGTTVLSADLVLHLFGGSDPSGAQPSLIQVLSINQDWQESSLTWNNAPYAWQNISRTWVNPVQSFPGWPGIAYTWDVSLAVAQAQAQGQPLRLVLYSADSSMHSGKYFVTSDTEDWNAEGRPTLQISWAD